MTSLRSAVAAALPAPLPALTDALPRRGFLRQLASLPLLGGGLSIIGQPRAVAEPVTNNLLFGYKDWLFYEHRMLSHELAGYDVEEAKSIERLSYHCGPAGRAGRWHFRFPNPKGRLAGWPDTPFQPSTRAALVLSAVGCDWRGD